MIKTILPKTPNLFKRCNPMIPVLMMLAVSFALFGCDNGTTGSSDGSDSSSGTSTINDYVDSEDLLIITDSDMTIYDFEFTGREISDSGTGISGTTYRDATVDSALTIYLPTSEGYAKTTDYGGTWDNKSPADGLADDAFTSIAVYEDTNYILAGTSASGISFSIDGGDTFNTYTTANSDLINDAINAVAFDGGGALYVGTDGGLSICMDETFAFVENVTSAEGLADDEVRDIFIGSSGWVYVSTAQGLSVSDTAGIGGTYVNYLTGVEINAMIIADVDGTETWFVCTGEGLYVSGNGGTSFQQFTTADDLPSDVITDIDVNSSNVYIATDSGLAIADIDLTTFEIKTTAGGLMDNYIYRVIILE